VERYADRREAGRLLAKALTEFAGRDDVVVLGLPRGGVVVAAEVAQALEAPLDAFTVRKVGAPGRPELAMGAVASGGIRVRNDDVIRWHGVTDETFDRVAAAEEVELARRERAYRADAAPLDLADKVVLLVDDGLATGASMRAAVRAVALQRPARIVVAVPVAAPDACDLLEKQGAEVVCPLRPRWFGGVGRFYRDFGQTSDEEVRRVLGRV
jgi:putative phosphoribosyl transferase